jgi:hypothetical protein
MVLKPKVERPLGKPRRMWVGNIKMDLREIGLGWYGLELHDTAQDQYSTHYHLLIYSAD